MLKNFNILQTIGLVLNWIKRDTVRPSVLRTVPALSLLILAPFFSTGAFLLLPLVIFQAGTDDALPVIGNIGNLTEILKTHSLWIIPLLFLIFATLNYLGHRQILRFSMIYQRQLASRVTQYYYAMIRGDAEGSPIDIGTIRKLIMGDSRYLARIYLSLYLIIPQLIMAALSFVVLIYFVPKLMVGLLVVFLVFLPAYLMVASTSRSSSAGFLAGSSRLSRHLPKVLKQLASVPQPEAIDPVAFEANVLDENSHDFFTCFEQRTKMTYFGGFVSNAVLAIMLAVLIILLPTISGNGLATKLTIGAILLISARYFFAGVTAIVRIFVAIGNTYPYYGTYLKVFPNSQWVLADQEREAPITFKSARDNLKIDLKGHYGIVISDDGQSLDDIQAMTGLGNQIVRVEPLSKSEWSEAKLQSSSEIAQRLQGLDSSQRFSKASGLIRAFAKYSSRSTKCLGITEDLWRLINQKRRTQILEILREEGIGLLVFNSNYFEFCKPFPNTLCVPDQSEAAFFEINREDQSFYASQTPVEPLDMEAARAERQIGQADFSISAPQTQEAWTAFNKLLYPNVIAFLNKGSPAVLKVSKKLVNFSELHRNAPQLSAIWNKVYAVITRSHYDVTSSNAIMDSLDDNICIGLAVAFSRNPDIVIVPHDVLSQFKQADRPQFLSLLYEAGVIVITLRTPKQAALKPYGAKNIAIHADGASIAVSRSDYVIAPPEISKPLSHMIMIDEKIVHIAFDETIGLIANQPVFDWTVFGHLKDVAGESVPRIFEKPSIISPGLFLESVPPINILNAVAIMDIQRLHFLYPALAQQWLRVEGLQEKFQSMKNYNDVVSEMIPSDAVYLTLAAALKEEISTLFIREDDFRLLPQSERMQITKALGSVLLVVWKNHMRTPFIKPRSNRAILLDNSGIISVTSGEATARDIKAVSYRRLTAERFQPAQFDSSDIIMED